MIQDLRAIGKAFLSLPADASFVILPISIGIIGPPAIVVSVLNAFGFEPITIAIAGLIAFRLMLRLAAAKL